MDCKFDGKLCTPKNCFIYDKCSKEGNMDKQVDKEGLLMYDKMKSIITGLEIKGPTWDTNKSQWVEGEIFQKYRAIAKAQHSADKARCKERIEELIREIEKLMNEPAGWGFGYSIGNREWQALKYRLIGEGE